MGEDVVVRHARPDDLPALDDVLTPLRAMDGLVERTPGSFYRKGKGFLHFHLDGDDVFCDVKLTGPTFDRVRVTTKAERRRLVADVRRALAS